MTGQTRNGTAGRMCQTRAMSENAPIHGCIERWHEHTQGRLDGGLDAVLHPDVVFLSPIVFTPQKGIDITKVYLGAAGWNARR